ncbi:SDR family oxidoreductase [Qaidamihabitans albus]|uniref:SDR family oxidoreductase n=1 Tax=Qaidamihabitans albus TaxID=2795733 RepID=UPI0027DD3CD7|nr:SDR family oxidoreductase [Qaidamihabitans albus]
MSGLVVITGGSRGIGAATARLAATRGWDVCVSYRQEAEAAAEVVADCRTAGAAALAVHADVAVEEDVLALFDQAQDRLGPLRGLVNNAGIVARQSRVADLDAARIGRLLAVNVVGAFLCAREAVRRMTEGGAIVNVSSRAAVLGAPGEYVDYAASKAAVDALTVGLAKEAAEDGIRVNAVRPGLIETDIHASGGEPGRPARIAPTVPMRRPGTAAETAEAIVWLLSPAASYVTGSFTDVSGGR